ncbi:Rhodanese-like domain-containing protein [Podospora fimiseda]|uniref:Rhodanese-like domain-containing protein n=1 Tax=Podospora fimiseda TaxID=252190 RepID=A0AAN7BLA5_9PEZI|nr:Rhodanese-like domain-containing protein [Podospora fimiseda]
MSSITLSSLNRITAPVLSQLLLADTAAGKDTSSIAIVDVRDDDYIGGHIKSALNFPSRTLDATLPTLIRQLEGKETVVFHCALSQQRGPGAALRYLREKERLAALEAAKKKKNKDGEEIEQGEDKLVSTKQKVYVLDRGFVGWQEEYGTDERLTEGYRKELWADGYWG